MYTYGLWDFQSTTIFLVIAIAVIFPLQLLLCFKGKSLLVRLCPVLLTLLLTVIPWIAVWITKSWLFLVIGYLALYYAAFFSSHAAQDGGSVRLSPSSRGFALDKSAGLCYND